MKKRKWLAVGLLGICLFAFAGCGESQEEEDAFEEDMVPLDEEELKEMEQLGAEELSPLEETQSVAEEPKEEGGDPILTEEELDAQVRQELEESGLAEPES